MWLLGKEQVNFSFRLRHWYLKLNLSFNLMFVLGDVALTKLVKLLIIDEVHLLHGDRGPVVEAIVARTLRQVP